jgi:hypothetical protein
MLRLLGAGIGSMGLAGVASASDDGASDGNGKPDTDFDPNDRESIRRFAQKFRRLDHEERERILEKLTDAQMNAVRTAFAVDTIVVESVDGETTDGDSETDDDSVSVTSYSTSYTVTLTALSWTGTVIWKWHHRIDWEYDSGDVTSASSSSWATEVDAVWSYDGTVSSWLNNDGHEFTSYRQDKFSNPYLGLGCNPSSELAGNGYGTRWTVSKSKGGC